jgi:hypothetical protein
MIGRLLIQTALLTASLAAFAQDREVVLGIVEEVPGVYSGESSNLRVRVVFSRQERGWRAFRSKCDVAKCLIDSALKEYPQEVEWLVGFEGREIGRVRGRTPRDFRSYWHIGLQDIVDGAAPRVGKPTQEYGNFTANERQRPLVALSKANFDDPDGWKPLRITSTLRDQAMTVFRSKLPRICKEGPSDKVPLAPLRYGPNSLSVRAHQSSNGWVVMTVGVKEALYCGPAAGDGSLDDHTFAINPAGKKRFLGTGLVLIDAGDYDRDGRSEVIFALSRYNRGGYVLFSNNFANRADFVFGYH